MPTERRLSETLASPRARSSRSRSGTEDRSAAQALDKLGGDMSQPLVYVDSSEVREGALEQLKDAIGELADFVEENERQLIAYNAFFSEDGRQMTVMHVHTDSASLDHHMEVAGPRFARFADLVRLSSIHIYGEP